MPVIGKKTLKQLCKEMCLEIHPLKSNYLVIGTSKYKKDVTEETKEDPIMFGEIKLKRAQCVT